MTRAGVKAFQGPAGGRFGRTEQVLARALLVYHRFDLARIEPARRPDALKLKLAAWRPFEASRYWVGWQRGIAQVWAWSDDQMPVAAHDGAPVPESALHPPLENGLRLVELVDGFEGQHWRDDCLQNSRWWNALPNAQQWTAFVRAAGQPPEDQVPSPVRLSWRQRPWARATGEGQVWLERHEMRLVLGAAILLALLFGWRLAGLWQSRQALEEQRERVESLQAQAGPELAAREQALADQARIDAVLDLWPEVNPVVLMQAVVEALPRDLQLERWQQQGGELELAVRSQTAPDAEQVLRALEPLPWLDDVFAEPDRNPSVLLVRALINRRLPEDTENSYE